jgi:hypothetical protein
MEKRYHLLTRREEYMPPGNSNRQAAGSRTACSGTQDQALGNLALRNLWRYRPPWFLCLSVIFGDIEWVLTGIGALLFFRFIVAR